MQKITFYTNHHSRGETVHWMLEEVGVPYETVWLEFGPQMKAPEYLAINPMGKVPALKHGNAIVTEVAAICTYLADVFPDRELAPPSGDPRRADFYRWLFFAAGPIEAVITIQAMGWQVPEGKSKALGFGSIEDTVNALKQTLNSCEYLCGDKFSAADLFVGASLYWGMLFDKLPKLPVFEAYVKRLHERPAYKRSQQLNQTKA